MIDNEIVRALRSLAVSRDNKCDNPTVMMLGKELVLNTAADLIESLQAQLTEVTQLALEVTGKYETSVKMHQITNTALAASQARERAAVECITGIEEAIKFQRYSAARLRISEWRDPQDGGNNDVHKNT